jgi:two-component system response regulator VicR
MGQEAQSKIKNLGKKKIVIIEDDADFQKALAGVLSPEFDVFKALDGEIGERVIEEVKPDLVVLDIILPGKSGFEVLKNIREKTVLKDTPVIVLTNLEGKSEIQKALALGVKIYLVKALQNLENVAEIIKNMLKAQV